MKYSFLNYVMEQEAHGQDKDHEKAEDIRVLKVLSRLVQRGGMTVKEALAAEKPYIFVWSHMPGRPVGGAKIFQQGGEIHYQWQAGPDKKREKDGQPQPFLGGSSYTLPMQQIFLNLMSDADKTEVQVVMAVADEVARRLKSWFKRMKKAIGAKKRRREEGEGRVRVDYTAMASNDYGSTMDKPM